jgi:hypothetical protein
VGVPETLLAERKRRKAVGTPPLKRSGHAALALCGSWDTLRTEKAT